MEMNFSYDPMYLTVFCIVRWIEKYHKAIEDKYTFNVVSIPEQYIGQQGFIYEENREEAYEKLFNSLETIQYKDIRENELMRDIINNKAKRFADFEYMSKYKLRLEEYDSELTEKLIHVYADKYNLSTVDFDEHEEIGNTIWNHIHNTEEWKDLYMSTLSNGHGDTGMGVYSETLKHFIPCTFAEHKTAIYEMLRMFEEFQDMEDYEFYSIVRHGNADKDIIDKMNYLVMNDFKLVGNKYSNTNEYI